MYNLTLNELEFVQVAHRSDQEHLEPLTWNESPMPCLHLNSRSQQTTRDDIIECFLEEINR